MSQSLYSLPGISDLSERLVFDQRGVSIDCRKYYHGRFPLRLAGMHVKCAIGANARFQCALMRSTLLFYSV